ncbi:MAG: translesion error-prone DNA polymerase V autoproteolytic subunit [Legionella sp.]|nr:translesion error-prone DNA polymerase V autoproteolytic subunit [Legionella sp.]
MPRGGYRPNAGRPAGQGKYKEPTKPMRIPLSKLPMVQRFLDEGLMYKFPLYASSVKAGFPSPADEHIERHMDLNAYCVANPFSTFFVRASGDSMINAGIMEGDLLVVDRSLEPTHGKIVIAAIDGELTVKRLYYRNGIAELRPENEAYQPLPLKGDITLVIWGVVLHVVRSL